MINNTSIIGSNFIMTNRDLISTFGVNSAIMLGELYGRRNYFRERNELKFGYFFATKESIYSMLKILTQIINNNIINKLIALERR